MSLFRYGSLALKAARARFASRPFSQEDGSYYNYFYPFRPPLGESRTELKAPATLAGWCFLFWCSITALEYRSFGLIEEWHAAQVSCKVMGMTHSCLLLLVPLNNVFCLFQISTVYLLGLPELVKICNLISGLVHSFLHLLSRQFTPRISLDMPGQLTKHHHSITDPALST